MLHWGYDKLWMWNRESITKTIEGQVCLEEIHGAIYNNDSKRSISIVEEQDTKFKCPEHKLVYGSETWLMKVEDRQRLERAERMMVRHMRGITLKDRKTRKELIMWLWTDSVSDVITRSRLIIRCVNVERRDDSDWVNAYQKLEVAGVRVRGRDKRTWRECVAEYMKQQGLKECDVLDRLKCRKGILGKLSDLYKHGKNKH